MPSPDLATRRVAWQGTAGLDLRRLSVLDLSYSSGASADLSAVLWRDMGVSHLWVHQDRQGLGEGLEVPRESLARMSRRLSGGCPSGELKTEAS